MGQKSFHYPKPGRSGAFKVRETAAAYGAAADASPPDVLALVDTLRRGLPYGAFLQLQEAMDVSANRLAEACNIAPRTLARRRKESRFLTDESERLWRLTRLFDRAEALLGREEARRWMQTPKRALAGRTPLQFADTEPGANEVYDLLGRLEHGVFS